MSAGDLDLGWEALKGLLANLVQAVLGFAGTIIFARVLGPTSFGGYYVLLSVIFLVNRPIWGIGFAARKRFSERDAPKGEIVSAIAVVNLALVAVAAAVLFGLDPLAGRTNVPDANLVFVTVLGSIIFFFPFQMLVDAAGKPGRATWIDTLRSVFTFPLQLAFVLGGFGSAGMGYGLAGATLLVMPVTYYSVRIVPKLPSRETFRSLWAFARYSIPGAFVGKAYDRFDVLLLGFVVGTAVSGQYEAAAKLTIPALFLSGPITSGLMPKVSNMGSKGEDPTDDISNALSYTSIIALPIFFGALALSRNLVVTAYGSAYAPAAPFLVGLALYKLISSQTEIHRSTLSGMDMPDINLRVSAFALAVNIVLGVWLIFEIGGIGVVVATVVAEFVQYLGAMLAVRRELPGVDILPTTLVEQGGAALVMYGALVALKGAITLDTLWVVALVVGAGAAVYGGVLLLVSARLRTTIRSVYADARAE